MFSSSAKLPPSRQLHVQIVCCIVNFEHKIMPVVKIFINLKKDTWDVTHAHSIYFASVYANL